MPVGEETNGSVDLIDPIEAVSRLPKEYNGAPEYEKMFTFVSMRAQRKGRSVITNNGGNTRISDSLDGVNINMLGYDQNSNQFTTNWSKNVDNNDTIYEGFGISSIKIKTNSSYVPQVDVEFRDIRGSAFFDLGDKSPYAVLFDFPPPIFELTVKGYYGRALTYQLHIVKHSTSYDAQRGDFVINASFIARTFAPLSDIPFKYIEMFPLINKETQESIDSKTQQNITSDNESLNPNSQNISNSVEPRNTHEMIKKLQSLYDDISELRDNSVESELSEEIQKSINEVESVISRLNNFKNFINTDKYGNLTSIVIKEDVDNDDDSGGKFREIRNIGLYDNVIKSNSSEGIPTVLNERLYLAIRIDNVNNTTLTDLSQLLNNRLIDIDREFIEFTKNVINKASSFTDVTNSDISTPKTIENFAQGDRYRVIDITNIYNKLKKYLNEREKKLKDNRDIIVGKINQTATETLGMRPTIYNIFKVICRDIDTFFKKLRTTTYLAEKHHNDSANRDLIINDNGTKERNINAFPLYIKKDFTDCIQRESRAIPTDLSEKIISAGGRPFPEINLINDFIRAFIEFEKENLVGELRTQEDDAGNNKWIPITPADSSLFIDNKESPYRNIEFQYQNILNQKIDKIYNKIIERFYVASQYTWGVQFYDNSEYVGFDGNSEIKITDIIKYAAGAEAVNLAQSLTDITTITNLKEKAEKFKSNVNDAFTTWNSRSIPAFNRVDSRSTNTTSKYAVIGNSNTPSIPTSEGDTVGGVPIFNDIGDLYKDRSSIGFIGVKILPNNRLPEKRNNAVNNTQSPVDKYLNSVNTGFFDKIKSKINGGEILPKEFSVENILYISDVDPDDDYQSKFVDGFIRPPTAFQRTLNFINPLLLLNQLTRVYSYTNSLTNVLSTSLAIHGEKALDVFENNTYSLDAQGLLLVSNFVKSRSYYHRASVNNQLNDSFIFPSVTEVPYFSVLYMGALVKYATTEELEEEFDEMMLTGFTTNVAYDMVILKRNARNVDQLLSDNDKFEFTRYFDEFMTNEGFFSLRRSYINLIREVLNSDEDVVNDGLINFNELEKLFQKSILNPDQEKQAFLYKRRLEGEYADRITNILTKKYAVVITNQFTFSVPNERDEDNNFVIPTIETQEYEPLSITNSDDRINRNRIYFEEFFRVLAENIKTQEEEVKNIENKINNNIGDNDTRTELYYSFKSISDKWIAGDVSNGKGFPLNNDANDELIKKFMFVDRAMNPIGEDCIINVEPLLDLVKDYDVSVFSVISQLLSHNGFEFFPLQNFMSFEKNNWRDGFKIFESIQQEAVPAFVCMYIGGRSSKLNNPSSQFDDDGILDLVGENLPDFKENPCNDAESNNEVREGQEVSQNVNQPYSQVKAFRVRYAEQNQAFFNSIQLEGRDFTETNDSLAILSRIAGDESKSSPVPKGQNLFNLYESRAYSARVKMLGNMLIQPTQYFQLENIPLYSGAYVILDVEHMFTPNHAITEFQGTRVLKYPNPIVKEFATTIGYQSGTADDTSGNRTNNTDLETQRQNPIYDEARANGFNDAITTGSATPTGKTFYNRNDEIIARLHPRVRGDFATLINTWEAAGFPMQINSGFRTFNDQIRLKAKEDSNANQVASPGSSFHNYGLAIDVSLIRKDNNGNPLFGQIFNQFQNPFWLEIAEIAERLGFRWGGRFRSFDPVHFEKTEGYGYFDGDSSANPIYDGTRPLYATKGTITDLFNKYSSNNGVNQYVDLG